ncbi:hypothetical protein GCM10027093_08760 [Paraburkholderia jirisanensis]
MSIAQHDVAGEGEVHPSQDGPDDNRIDAAALVAFQSEAVNLPWIIFRAAFRASRVDALPSRARAVLAALARTVDAARPYAAIYARRELLMDRAMLSPRTFYRSLDDLESTGLITRTVQARYVEVGKFGRVHLHLTEHAATLLGLVEAVTPPSPTPTPAAPAGSFEGPCANVADGAIYGDLPPPAFQKRQPGQVPADLQRLLPLGFSKFLIFNLMKQARKAGKRLSDVVEATWAHLKAAKRPICYLRALLRNPVDFGYQVRVRDAEHAASRDTEAERDAAQALVAELAGQTLVDETGTRKLVLDAEGASLAVYSVDESVPRHEAGDWQLRFARAVRSGRIRVASEEDLEAFAQERRSRTVPLTPTPDAPRVITATAGSHLANLRAALRGIGIGAGRAA